jgi:predicted ABC-type ATPase
VPNLFVLAGPNGAGKSTSAPGVLTGPRAVAEFVNADVIAKEQGLSDVAAGRVTLKRLNDLAAAHRDIAFETTLASHLLLPRIQAMQEGGYDFHLYFFWLPSADMAVRRVARRVASGGHHIPEDVIRRRYERGLENFFRHYALAADSWTLFDNSAAPARRIAWRDIGSRLVIGDNELWRQLSARYMRPRAEEGKARLSKVSWTSEDVLEAVNRAVTVALKRHKERGDSIVQWRDGKIETIPPEHIDV